MFSLHRFLVPHFGLFIYGATSHFRAMASPISFNQPSAFLAAAFQCRVWSKSTPSFKTQTSHLPLGLPMAYLRLPLFDFCKELITHVQISHLR